MALALRRLTQQQKTTADATQRHATARNGRSWYASKRRQENSVSGSRS
jgi:hypothetical protein